MNISTPDPAPAAPGAGRLSLLRVFGWLRWRIAERAIERAAHHAAIRSLQSRVAELESDRDFQKRLRGEAENEAQRLSELCQSMRRSWARRLGRGRGTCEFSRVWIP